MKYGIFQKGGVLMSDVNSDNFIAPYSPDDVYGLGVVGPSSLPREEVEGKDQEEMIDETTSRNNQNSSNETQSASSAIEETAREEKEVSEIKNSENNNPTDNSVNNPRLEEHLGGNIDTIA